jgi:pimeloyl-ACP methyl ester carboxylesterase
VYDISAMSTKAYPETGQHVPVKIKAFKRSEALLSIAPARTAIVFVHGFLGDRRKTWLNFQGMADFRTTPAWWSQCDMYFYSYPSFRQQVGVTASKLEAFINHVFPRPPSQILRLDSPFVSRTELSPRSYTDLVLVGHSEGGLILRAMLIRRIQGHKDVLRRRKTLVQRLLTKGAEVLLSERHELALDPVLKSTLVLFAPAHLGRNVSGLTALVPKVLVAISNAYNNMAPESQIVTQTRERTEQLATEYPELTSLIANIRFGEKENIVVVGQFSTDWKYLVLDGHNHTSICKPNKTYLDPISLVGSSHARDKSIHVGFSR